MYLLFKRNDNNSPNISMTGQYCTTSLNIAGKTNDTFTWTIKYIARYAGEYVLDRVLSNEFIVKGTDGKETKWSM